MDDVEPLKESNLLVDKPDVDADAAAEPPPAGQSPSPVSPPVSPSPQPAPPSGPPSEPDLRHGEAPGLDRRTQTRMRRGQIDIEARIDLHGMTQAQAHRALGGFLFDQQAIGRRSVLVITGKGVGGEGVLRDAVPRWLNEGGNRRMVRAFSHAAPKDGGEGALYVLLKRLK
jgi:DNA-nicking Smr family endonuclease